jgi:hypothetical protein
LFFAFGWIFLGKLGFDLAIFGIGKEFSAIVGNFFLFQVILVLKPLEEYKGIHPPPRFILFSI